MRSELLKIISVYAVFLRRKPAVLNIFIQEEYILRSRLPFMKVQKQYFVLVRTRNNLLVVAEIFEHFIVVAINPYLNFPIPIQPVVWTLQRT